MPIPPVPVPSSLPSYPVSGSGQSPYYNLLANYSSGQPIPASALELIVSLLDNCAAAALASSGQGTITGGVASAPVGLAIPLTEWYGILPNSSLRLGFAPGLTAAQSVTVGNNSTWWIWAVPTTGALADGAVYDTAESGIAVLTVVYDGSTPDGGTPICSGTSAAGAITSGPTDQRYLSGITGLAAALAAQVTKEAADITLIESVIGSGYFPSTGVTTLATIAVRLATLEGTTTSGGGGGTSGSSAFWGALARSASDTMTIPVYVAAQIPAPLPVVTPTVLTDDSVVVNGVLKSGLGLIGVAGNTTQTDKYLDCIFIVPGITNIALIDTVHTTAAMDTTLHTIG